MPSKMTLEMMEYAKKHLFTHLKEAGFSDEKIEARIARIPENHDLRPVLANQFIESLPADKRSAVAARLHFEYHPN